MPQSAGSFCQSMRFRTIRLEDTGFTDILPACPFSTLSPGAGSYLVYQGQRTPPHPYDYSLSKAEQWENEHLLPHFFPKCFSPPSNIFFRFYQALVTPWFQRVPLDLNRGEVLGLPLCPHVPPRDADVAWTQSPRSASMCLFCVFASFLKS